jgi:hypothetical protein
MCDFQPGDVVVCVDAGPSWHGIPHGLVERQCYTIKDVDPVPDVDGNAGCHLVELTAPSGTAVRNGRTLQFGGFATNRFRRVYRPDGSLIGKLMEPVGENA